MDEQELLSYTPLICDIINKRFRFFLINNQHLYDDLIQSAYIQIHEKISYFDETKCKKSTFVYLEAYKGMLQHIYKWYGRNKNVEGKINKPSLSFELFFTENNSDMTKCRFLIDSERGFENVELNSLIDNTLNPKEKHILLSIAKGVKQRELAEQLNMTVGGVSWVYKNAQKKLNKSI